MKNKFARGIMLMVLLSLSLFAEKPKVDCFLVENSVARYIQQVVTEMKQTKAPDNCCGAYISISISTNDQAWQEDFNITAGNHFYFTELSNHLAKWFRRYDMDGGDGAWGSNAKTWAYRVGISDERFINPYDTINIGKRYTKKTFAEGTQCSMVVHITNEWYVSKPLNKMQGVINIITKTGKTEKLKKGRLKFTRLGPNNGAETTFETEISDGAYATEPKMPSGHYRVELIEPKSCQKVLEENWVFKSGIDTSKNFKVKCNSCRWKVEVKGDYTVCSDIGGCRQAKGRAIWESLPIAMEGDKNCHSDVPRLQHLPDSPFDMLVLNPESEAKVTGDFLVNDKFFINIAQAIPKQGATVPKYMRLGDRPIFIDFNTQSKALEELEDLNELVTGSRNEFSIGATHQCFIPAQGFMKWGECKDRNLKEKLIKREAFSFSIDEVNPFGGKEKSHFEFSFTPID